MWNSAVVQRNWWMSVVQYLYFSIDLYKNLPGPKV